MNKLIAFLLALACLLCLAGCGKGRAHQIEFTVPAGGTEDFLISREEICATGKKITIASDQDAEVILIPVSDAITPGYVATRVAPGSPAEFDAAGDAWFKIGLRTPNNTGKAKAVSIAVQGVELRTP